MRKKFVVLASVNRKAASIIGSLVVSLTAVVTPATSQTKHDTALTGSVNNTGYREFQGLTDLNGKQILPPLYASITYAGNDLFIVREKLPPVGTNSTTRDWDKTFVINRDGTKMALAIPPESTLSSIRYFGKEAKKTPAILPTKLNDDALIVFLQNRNMGLCDRWGKVILPAEYEWIGLESEGKIVLRSTKRKLFVFDVDNKKISRLLCKDSRSGFSMFFTEGLAVIDEGGPKYLTPTNKRPIKIRFSEVENFVDGRALVHLLMIEGRRSGGVLIDRTGKIVSPPNMNIISHSGGYSVVCLGLNKWGVVDRDFKFIVEPEYWLILEQPATVYGADDFIMKAQKPPTWFYASKGEKQITEVLSKEGKLLCTLPQGTEFPFAPDTHYADGAILCDIGRANKYSVSYYVNLKGERIDKPFSELSSSSKESFHEIAPGRLLKTVKP